MPLLNTPLARTVLIVSIGLVGCSTTPEPAPATEPHEAEAAPTPRSPTGTWTLSMISGVDLQSALRKTDKAPALTIGEDGQVTGYTGVNGLSSSIDVAALKHGDFRMGPIITTKRAGPPEAMDLERRFLAALAAMGTFEATERQLQVRLPSGQALVFARSK